MITISKLDIVLGIIILFLINFLAYTHLFRSKNSDSQEVQEAEIHDIIEKVRTELKMADENRISKNEAALFEVKTFDLEINFVAKTTEKESGEIKTELIAISGGNENTVERLQKITLHLETVPPKNLEIPPDSDTNEEIDKKTENKKNK